MKPCICTGLTRLVPQAHITAGLPNELQSKLKLPVARGRAADRVERADLAISAGPAGICPSDRSSGY